MLSETTNGQTIYYWRGLDTLAQSDGTNVSYFEYDGLGSVRQLSDDAGIVSLTQTFDPYGNGYAKAGSAATSYGFTGEQTDANGFVYLRARYYNPTLARFLNTDPSRQELNPYQYGRSNPVLNSDPTGLIPERSDVKGGHAEYSCNCGWIDWTHTGVGQTGLRMLHALDFASQANTCEKHWLLAASYLQKPPTKMPVVKDVPIVNFTATWIMPTDSPELADPIARLGMVVNMYKQYSMLIEQGQTPYAAVAPTDYSEEDLFSDFLGFWQQIYGKSDQDIRNICASFVRWQGDQVGIAASLYVYDNVYGGWMSPTWKRGWTSFEPRLIPLPQLNFSSAWSPIYNQCLINHSARCMPSEISTLLALEKTDPQDYTSWVTLLPEWKRFSDQNVALGTWIH